MERGWRRRRRRRVVGTPPRRRRSVPGLVGAVAAVQVGAVPGQVATVPGLVGAVATMLAARRRVAALVVGRQQARPDRAAGGRGRRRRRRRRDGGGEVRATGGGRRLAVEARHARRRRGRRPRADRRPTPTETRRYRPTQPLDNHRHHQPHCIMQCPSPIVERSIVMSVSVCPCVCVCVSVRGHIFGTTRTIFTKFVVPVNCGRGSVLLWRRSDTLCTSGLRMTSYLLISQGCSTSPPS